MSTIPSVYGELRSKLHKAHWALTNGNITEAQKHISMINPNSGVSPYYEACINYLRASSRDDLADNISDLLRQLSEDHHVTYEISTTVL